MGRVAAFCKRKNIEFSAKRYGIDALGAMAQGLFCSLLIGTAKGGIVIAVADALQIPVKFIGVGEKMDDLMPLTVRSSSASSSSSTR